MLRLASALLVLFGTIAADAQDARFGEKIEVKLIEVDVVVTNRKGTHVPGLTADDFEILEGGALRQITNFSEYRAGAAPAVTAPEGTAPSSPASPQAREPHTLIVLIDTLPRAGFARARAFEGLQSLLPGTMQKDDRVAVFLWTAGYERAALIVDSSDPETVRSALRQLSQKPAEDTTHRAIAAQAKLESDFFDQAAEAVAGKGSLDLAAESEFTTFVSGELELMRFRRKTAAMKHLISSLAGRPGRKSVLYVSNGFAMPGSGTPAQAGDSGGERVSGLRSLQDLTRAANAAGVTFYAVHPATPDPASDYPQRYSGAVQALQNSRAAYDRDLDALRNLVRPTGGLLDIGLRGVESVGARMAEDVSSYYSLAYRAPSDGADHERKITVRTKNHDYRIRMRESFVEKSSATIARETVVARLFTKSGADDLPFSLVQGKPRASGKNWLVPVELKIPTASLRYASEEGAGVAHAKVFIVAANGLAEVTPMKTDDLRVVAGKDDPNGFVSYSVEILAEQRGSKVSIGVFDVRSGLLGVKTLDTRGMFH